MGNHQAVESVSARLQNTINEFETNVSGASSNQATLARLKGDFDQLKAEMHRLMADLEAAEEKANELSRINKMVTTRLLSVMDSIKSVIDEPA